MMTVKLDFEVRCGECDASLYATFHEEFNRGVTKLVIVAEPCKCGMEEKDA